MILNSDCSHILLIPNMSNLTPVKPPQQFHHQHKPNKYETSANGVNC